MYTSSTTQKIFFIELFQPFIINFFSNAVVTRAFEEYLLLFTYKY